MQRLKVILRGSVQGVGFRPFVHRLATELHLAGWVQNTLDGVEIEAEGDPRRLTEFLVRVEREAPPRSAIYSLESRWLEPRDAPATDFEIRHSTDHQSATPILPADIATCAECRRELFDPANRRYRYPFINCTNCGPRYSILESFPYDRERTTMRHFTLCPLCRREYEDPADRRFHAQPNACPRCGPQLALWNSGGRILRVGELALVTAAAALRAGRIVALKGLGGFHLLVDAANENAVRRLRARKAREEKPFALLFPDLESIRAACTVEVLEERLLTSPEAPIVLLRRAPGGWRPAPSVAPRNPTLGAMLPYTPLHLLLLAEMGRPLVATSGNVSEEPLCFQESTALERLGDVADVFLVHDRPIAHPVDDSITCVMAGREMLLRRARGYAPLPLALPSSPTHVRAANGAPPPVVLAVGALQKNTLGIVAGSRIYLSQHLGDLESEPVERLFRRTSRQLPALLRATPDQVACDLHPDYLSTRFAAELALPVTHVQHHHAHLLACMAENEIACPFLGVAWDGTGLGTDHTLWGGEFLVVSPTGFERFAHLRPFPLPGGDRAAREPRRAALGLLYAWEGEALWKRTHLPPVDSFRPHEHALLHSMLPLRALSPLTSSIGRLFDAVAALLGLNLVSRFEGQAAMALEFALDPEAAATAGAYGFSLDASKIPPRTPDSRPMLLDWAPLLADLLADLDRGEAPARISARFHNALASVIVGVAMHCGLPRVALSGGCFQNRYLTERVIQELRGAGLRPYWHQRVPPNDGGIALGQAVAAVLHPSPAARPTAQPEAA